MLYLKGEDRDGSQGLQKDPREDLEFYSEAEGERDWKNGEKGDKMIPKND